MRLWLYCFLFATTGLCLSQFARAAESNISLAIDGGSAELQENVRAHLDMEALDCDISERQLLRELRGAGEKISQAFRALGYYHGQWQISHKADRKRAAGIGKKLTNQRLNCWSININIHAGKPVTIARLDVQLDGEAGQDQAFQAFLAALPLSPGQRLDHGRYEDIKKGLNQRARNRGYFDARLLQHRLEIDKANNAATIFLHFDSGQRYRFGNLSFSESPLEASLLQRFLPFQSGDYFDSAKLIEFQSKLISSGYFDSVSVDQNSPDASNHHVPIEISTTAKSRFETTIGIGASTDTGPRLSYGLRNRRVNPQGDTYQISSQLSPVLSNLGFQYTQPRANPLTEKLIWSTGIQEENTDTVDSLSFRAEVALVDEISYGWLQTTSLKFLQENYEIADEDNTSVLLIPGIAWTQSRSNDPRYPTTGWRLNTAIRGTLKEVVSDISLFQAEIDGKFILPLLGGRIISRGNLAATALDEFENLPASLRYFAGGDNSVRGYGYKDLGPEDSEGNVIGGKHRITASVEYDHKVWREFALATFYDVGNAFDTEDFTLYHSAGIGLRWFSPIGPIRFDLAVPLKDGGFRIHLSMGPDL